MQFLIGTVEAAISKNNKPFLKVAAIDTNKASHTLYVWNNIEAFKATAEKFKVLEIGTNLEDQFPSVETFTGASNDPTPFIKTAFPSDQYAMQLLEKLLSNITDPIFQELNRRIFTPEIKQRFATSTAAKSMHHNYHGGLLLHTFQILQFVSSICNSDLGKQLDKQVVLEGALLHDIGKLADYSTEDEATYQYTPEFYLSNHLSRGAEVVAMLAPDLLEDVRVRHVQHIIRSHHLLQEWGAIMPPATNEAVLVFLGDYFSASLDKFANADFTKGPMAKVGPTAFVQFTPEANLGGIFG